MTFLIGGADGLDPELKKSARMMLRISSMTLPHAFARVLLCEQIYRAWSNLKQPPLSPRLSRPLDFHHAEPVFGQ